MIMVSEKFHCCFFGDIYKVIKMNTHEHGISDKHACGEGRDR